MFFKFFLPWWENAWQEDRLENRFLRKRQSQKERLCPFWIVRHKSLKTGNFGKQVSSIKYVKNKKDILDSC